MTCREDLALFPSLPAAGSALCSASQAGWGGLVACHGCDGPGCSGADVSRQQHDASLLPLPVDKGQPLLAPSLRVPMELDLSIWAGSDRVAVK